MPKSKKEKLVFVITNLKPGGAERVLLNLLRHLDRNKYDINLFLLKKEGVYFSEVPNYVKIHSALSSEERISFNILKIIKKLICVCYNSKVIIGSLELDSTYFAVFVAKLLFKKNISWVHTNLQKHSDIQIWYQKVLSKIFYYITDCVICVSNDSLKAFRKNFKHRNSICINNILDYNIINKLSNTPINDTFLFNNEYICSIGRLTYPKDFILLIDAYKLLIDTGRINKDLLIFGDGVDYTKIKSHIIKNNLEDKVFLMGFKSNVFPYLKKSKLFILPSLFEGLPGVLLEAMSLRIPVIATDKVDGNGISEILENGKYGFLVQSYDPRDLAEKIYSVLALDKEILYEKLVFAESRLKDFSPNFIVNQWEKII